MNELTDSPFNFIKNPDGSVSFSIKISGTIDPLQVAELLHTAYKVQSQRIDKTACDISYILGHLPEQILETARVVINDLQS